MTTPERKLDRRGDNTSISSATSPDWLRWAAHLRAIAQPVIDTLDVEADWRMAIARPQHLLTPLLARRLGRTAPTPPLAPIARGGHRSGALTIDLALWYALINTNDQQGDAIGAALARIQLDDHDDCMGGGGNGGGDGGGAGGGDGPLAPQSEYITIEVWTESELAGLHALCNLALERNRERILRRVRRTVDWHIENTQPDNATNHPWALHAFLMRSRPEATHFAETLLNNCMVLNGRPDPMSAWILMDAAETLEQSAGTPASSRLALD